MANSDLKHFQQTTNDTEKQFTDTLSHYRKRVEQTLTNVILTHHTVTPLLCDAMLYATLNGGKRLRPMLVYATAYSFGSTDPSLDYIAAAIECMHSFSLIHDDLPAMDDDTLRRGKATCHILFGEATAILAGDALQTLSFELLSRKDTAQSPVTQIQLIQILARHSGTHGMAGGQSLDLLAEGKTLSAAEIEHIHALKTGGLIRASILMGAIGAGCTDESVLTRLDQFAERVGLAFQLQDDVLDITGTSKNFGKTIGQDIKNQKATYAILLGIENTQNRIHQLMAEAMSLIQSLPQTACFLERYCRQLIKV